MNLPDLEKAADAESDQRHQQSKHNYYDTPGHDFFEIIIPKLTREEWPNHEKYLFF